MIDSASKRDKEAALAKHKSRALVHGYKVLIAADKDTEIIREVETTPANEADVNIAPSTIPDDPGEVYGDKAYDALSAEAAIEAKGGTAKLLRKGHRFLPAEALEEHNHPRKPIRSRIEKILAPGSVATGCGACDGSAWRKPNSKSISRRLPTISSVICGYNADEL